MDFWFCSIRAFQCLYRTGDGKKTTIGDMVTKKILLLLFSGQSMWYERTLQCHFDGVQTKLNLSASFEGRF